MYLKQSFDQSFDELMFHLKEKYPAAIFDLEGIGADATDLAKFSKKFFSSSKTADASVDANANVGKTNNVTYMVEAMKPHYKLNSLFILYTEHKRLFGTAKANDMIERVINGDLLLNDSTGIASGHSYCYNYSTYDIMLLGLPASDKAHTVPPKHLFSFKSQLEQFIILASNSTLGATGLADMLIVVSLYFRRVLANKKDANFTFANEEDCWAYLKEILVSFFYSVNFELRAAQSPFTNISLYDEVFRNKMCEAYLDPVTGEAADPDLLFQIQELAIDIFNDELERSPLTFPVWTACFAKHDETDEVIDQPFIDFIAEKSVKFGFMNFYGGKSSTLSSCCRLRSETDNEYFNSFGGSTKIGSGSVCTINLARVGAQFGDDTDELHDHIENLVTIAQQSNYSRRKVIQKRIDGGFLPLYSAGYMALETQFATVGLNGIYELCELTGHDILSPGGEAFLLGVLYTINTTNDKMAKRFGIPTNCELIPAEGSSIKLAKKDHAIGINKEYVFYSNQFIPLQCNADLLDRVRLQGVFDGEFSGGSILHINLDKKASKEQIAKMIRYAFSQGVIYYAINFVLNRCEDGHMSVGNHDVCDCGKPITDKFTRVVGFLANIGSWAKERREHDFPMRQFYDTIDV